MTDAKTQSFYRYIPVGERDVKWGLYVTTAGRSHILPNTPYPPGQHPKEYTFNWSHGRALHDYTLVYISGGRGWLELKDKPKQRIESGNVIMLLPGTWHRYMPAAKTGWTEHWVVFNGEMAHRLTKNGFFSSKSTVLKIHREDLLLSAFKSMIDAIKSNQPALQQVLAGVTGHILALLYSDKQSAPAGQSNVASAIQEAISQINNKSEADLDLHILAQKLHVSYTWFRRSFLQHTGMSPYQYILQMRIARARNLLTATTMTIQQAAFSLGFESDQYFCRLFKKKTGLTPSAWRKQSRTG